MSDQRSKHPSRGRRYSPAEKAAILADVEPLGVAGAADEHRCSKWTIYDWLNKRKRAKKAAQTRTSDQDLAPNASDQTEKPEPKASQDERHQMVVEIWRQQPGLGPSQIRNQIKRKGFKISVNTVRTIMEEHGYVQPKARRREHTGEYEAVRPLQLYHLDFFHFHVHRQKQCMLLIIDDFSRFIPGWALLRSEHADGVISAFETTVERYGKPEAVMTDRGADFHSWRGLSRFETLLEEYGIDHYLSKEPQVNGKAEALAATVQKELIRQVEFADLTDAHSQMTRWVRFYNYQRTHHGLGGLLVPSPAEIDAAQQERYQMGCTASFP